MNKHTVCWGLLVAACLSLAACQDRREPVKPTVAFAAPAAAPAPAALVVHA